ncbi:MAG: response regulator [Isosphaeraceae bacterium]|nr:response regulator [Isosphaeraceae bacterium]
MPDEPKHRILVVEDDPDARANMIDILELDDFEVCSAGSSAEALERIEIGSYFAVIVDRRLPDVRLDELLPALKERAPGASFIVVTGYADINGAIAALRQGADDYILKPLNPEALRTSLARLLEQRRLSREKERSEAAFRHVVEAAECLILLLSLEGRLIYLSPYGERITGRSGEDHHGHDFGELFLQPFDVGSFRELLRTVRAGRSIRGRKTNIRCANGSTRAVLWNLRRVDDYDDDPVILLVGQDITELERAQEQALRAERLAAIGQMMTGLAHESRNALQRSQACLEMLGLVVGDLPAAVDYISRIQKAQDDLARLYEDVRSYAAPIKLECAVCDLSAIWREAWSQLEPRSHPGRVELEERIHTAETPSLVADAFRLEQVFRNIFDNALAAGRGDVRVVIEARDVRLDSFDAVEIRILDDGPGLGTEQRGKIFETFYTTKTKGTGLGMPISKRIVEAHGGTIALGEGARLGPTGAEIIVTLPKGLP